jgi:hypothetical protein
LLAGAQKVLGLRSVYCLGPNWSWAVTVTGWKPWIFTL